MEDTQLLQRHFDGRTLSELAVVEGVNSPETIRQRLLKSKRAHITQIAGRLMLARRDGEILWLAIPGNSSADLHAGLVYVDWLLRELEDVTFRCRVHFASKPDGVAIGLEEYVDAGGAGR